MFLPIFALTLPLLISSAAVPADESLCKNLKPKETTSYFARGDGPYSMKLTHVPKENIVQVDITAKEGNHFEGKSIDNVRRKRLIKECREATNFILLLQ